MKRAARIVRSIACVVRALDAGDVRERHAGMGVAKISVDMLP